MASLRVVVNGEKDEEQKSPQKKYMKRTVSMNEATSPSGGSKHCVCVCAPTTHAGSFKCRLHRGKTLIGSSSPNLERPSITPLVQLVGVKFESISTVFIRDRLHQ